jgi:hypothetical protein
LCRGTPRADTVEAPNSAQQAAFLAKAQLPYAHQAASSHWVQCRLCWQLELCSTVCHSQLTPRSPADRLYGACASAPGSSVSTPNMVANVTSATMACGHTAGSTRYLRNHITQQHSTGQHLVLHTNYIHTEKSRGITAQPLGQLSTCKGSTPNATQTAADSCSCSCSCRQHTLT